MINGLFPILRFSPPPCRHVRHCIETSDSDTTMICFASQPCTTTHQWLLFPRATQPIPFSFASSHAIHCTFCIQRSKSTMSIPTFNRSHLHLTSCSCIRINLTFLQVADNSWKTVQSVGVYTSQTVLCENDCRILGIFMSESFFSLILLQTPAPLHHIELILISFQFLRKYY